MEVTTKTYSGKLRPLMLTLAMLVSALLASLSLKDRVSLIGVLFLSLTGGIFATIFLTVKKEWHMVLGASGAVYLLQFVGSFTASLMGVTVLIAAFVLAYHVKRRNPKTAALLALSITLGVGFLLTAAVLYAVRGGSLAPSDLLDKYNEFFRTMKIESAASVHEMVEGFDKELIALYERSGITKEMLLESYLSTMEASVDAIQLMLPGIVIFLIQVIAYIEIVSFRAVARVCRVEALLPAPRWHMYPTQVSCVVYLIVAVLYMFCSFFSSSDSVFLMLVSNMWLALLPVMMLCGARVLWLRLQHPLYRIGTGIMLTAFIFGFFFLRSVAVQLALFTLSFLGAQTVWTQRMLEAEKQKKE